jgi:hypothetical protein
MMDPYRTFSGPPLEDTVVETIGTFDWSLCWKLVGSADPGPNPGWSDRQWRIALRCPTCHGPRSRGGGGPWTEPSRPSAQCVNGHVMPCSLIGEPRR